MDVGHEQAVIAVGHKTAQLGGGLAVGSGITAKLAENYDAIASFGVLVGVGVGVFGLVVQWHFQKKRDNREQLLHDHRMKNGKF